MAEATLAVELATPGENALLQRNDASPSKIPVVPVPTDAPPMQFRHPKHGKPSASWPYENSDGDLIGYVCRWDIQHSDGTPDKTFLPVCYCDLGDGHRAWRSSRFPEPRSLYRLPDILARPDATVLVTEGEKACDAAAALFADLVVTTPPHGAMSSHKTDWSPMRGRQVVIWPDHDEAGRKFAEVVAGLAIEAGAASVHIVNTPMEFPEKWDLADPVPEGWTDDHLRNLLTEAIPESIDDTVGDRDGEEAGGGGRKQADILIEQAANVQLFHTPDDTPYADIQIHGHRETWPVRQKGFKSWLTREFYLRTRGAPNANAMNSALAIIEATAKFDSPEMKVHVRIAGKDGKIYIDLADNDWRAIEVDSDDWRIVDEPPVRFRRAAGMQPLPVPVAGGSVETLRSFLNVRSDADFVLVVAWVLACLRDRGPYPVIVLAGEQGSAKSTFSAILRALIDPNTAPLRALPREDRDLFIAATNGHVLAFDNVSGLRAWISDTICRLATGGGFAVRQLYTDQDEVLFDATRPVILNGIEDIVTRPDLADRAIFLTLEPIPEESRRSKAELWAAFEAERPLILGALLDAMVQGLRMLPQTELERLPRMADFALWATACEGAFCNEGAFLRAYTGNRDEAVENVIEGDPVAAAVRTVMLERTVWTGTATDLLDALAKVAGERVANSKTWPNGPRALSGRLRRAANFLRKVGIEIDNTKKGKARTRVIHITATDTSTDQDSEGYFSSAPSAASADKSDGNGNNELANTIMRTQTQTVRTKTRNADANADGPSVRNKARKSGLEDTNADGADGADANIPAQSGGWRARV